MREGGYSREKVNSLFELFYYVEGLMDVPADDSFSSLVNPTFYSPNVSWIVQRNGHSPVHGMMISKNASLGNHSHTNGVNIELFAKGMVIAPDCAAGVSYWSNDHREYYSRFAAHNTVVVDGISDYRNMRGSQAFEVNSIYPKTGSSNPLFGDFTFSDVTFTEPSTNAKQHRITGTIRTSGTSGYFIDIFRSSRSDGRDKKHEYLFHSQGEPILLQSGDGRKIPTQETDELSSKEGDLVGYDYFRKKKTAQTNQQVTARFKMPSISGDELNVHLWMNGEDKRQFFTVEAPYSRAISKESVPEELYQKDMPTLVVRQIGEARTKPFVAIIDAFEKKEGASITAVHYFHPKSSNPVFVGVEVHSLGGQQELIFSDANPGSINVFDHSRFNGRLGVMSKEVDEIRSLLLDDGNLLEYGDLSIVVPGSPGDVLVKLLPAGIEVDAAQPFELTLPLKRTGSGTLELIGQDDPKLFKGIVVQEGGESFATFKLPALNRAMLRLL